MRQNVIRDQSDAFRGKKRLFPVDVPNLFVVNIRLGVHRFDVVHPEGQYIFVVNGVHDGVSVELIAKSLLCRAECGILAHACIDRKDGRAGKAKEVVLLEILRNGLMHIPELTPVALIKNDNNSLIKNAVSGVLFDESCQLLDGGNDDLGVVIFQLTLQHRCGGVAVGSALFKAVIFLHRLIVQILAVHDKKHLVDIIQLRGKLRRFEGSQRFAAAGGVPDVPAACYGAVFLIIVGDLNAVQNALGGDDLIWPHHQQHIFRRKYTVTGKNIQNGVLAEKGLGKVHKIGDNAVVRIRPERSELKAIAGFGLLGFLRFGILDMVETGGIGIILRICAVGDHEDLHEFIQSAGCPEAVPLIAIDLVKRFPNGNAPALQLDMDEWQTVDQHRHIIAIVMSCPLLCGDGILVDDLQTVIMDALLVNKLNIFAFPVIPAEHLHIVLLNQPGLFENAGVCVCQHLVPETLPFAVRKAIVIQLFQLRPQIGNQVSLFMDGQALIAQLAKQTDKLLFQVRFALVRLRALRLRLVFGDDGAFTALGNDVEIAHGLPPSGSICRCKSQQLVPVVFILFLLGFDFGGKAGGKVSAKSVKTVENGNDSLLYVKRRDRYSFLCKITIREKRLTPLYKSFKME